jgi:Na+/H+-dicarboxylate symporter
MTPGETDPAAGADSEVVSRPPAETLPPVPAPSPAPSKRWPLFVRILIGVAVGATFGFVFRDQPILFGWTNSQNQTLAWLYIQLLSTLATPLIFFAIVEAFVQTPLTGRQGAKMFAICALNIAVAFAIGLTILNVWQPGKQWQGQLEHLARQVDPTGAKGPKAGAGDPTKGGPQASLSPLSLLQSYIPKNIVQPFAENMVLTVALLAILVGASMRSLLHSENPEIVAAIGTFGHLIVAGYQILLKVLMGLIELAPFAIALAVSAAVGDLGADIFRVLGVFVATIVSALAIHSLVYYPLSAWLIGGKSPRVYIGEGLPAILTGLSINSSLATVPLTLSALRRMGVSEASARMSACVRTNFNNDGITLYEATTALFIAQATGMSLSLPQQILILLAALVGSLGIAGIPNSGLIILTLVLKAAKFSDEAIQLAIPLVFTADVIHNRLRSAVNVMGDMQVAILLDAGVRPESGSQ